MILLTDEEIRILIANECNAREVDLLPDSPSFRNEYGADTIYTWPNAYQDKRLVESVAKAQLRKVVEWELQYCDNPYHSAYADGLFRVHCPECRQALLKEVDNKG